jgi:hypothetical protein
MDSPRQARTEIVETRVGTVCNASAVRAECEPGAEFVEREICLIECSPRPTADHPAPFPPRVHHSRRAPSEEVRAAAATYRDLAVKVLRTGGAAEVAVRQGQVQS